VFSRNYSLINKKRNDIYKVQEKPNFLTFFLSRSCTESLVWNINLKGGGGGGGRFSYGSDLILPTLTNQTHLISNLIEVKENNEQHTVNSTVYKQKPFLLFCHVCCKFQVYFLRFAICVANSWHNTCCHIPLFLPQTIAEIYHQL
jgi:hypothetical protein